MPPSPHNPPGMANWCSAEGVGFRSPIQPVGCAKWMRGMRPAVDEWNRGERNWQCTKLEKNHLPLISITFSTCSTLTFRSSFSWIFRHPPQPEWVLISAVTAMTAYPAVMDQRCCALDGRAVYGCGQTQGEALSKRSLLHGF